MSQLRTRRHTLLLGICAFLVLPLAAGCSNSPYVRGYSYYPQPALVEVYHRGSPQQTPLTVLATVLGVRQADRDRHIPYSVAARLRFDNTGAAPITFDPHSLELVTGSLRPFPAPITEPPNSMTLAPGQRQEFTVYFPFPPNTTANQMDLNHLRLRWEVQIDHSPVVQTALFDRTSQGYNEEPPSSYGGSDVY